MKCFGKSGCFFKDLNVSSCVSITVFHKSNISTIVFPLSSIVLRIRHNSQVFSSPESLHMDQMSQMFYHIF